MKGDEMNIFFLLGKKCISAWWFVFFFLPENWGKTCMLTSIFFQNGLVQPPTRQLPKRWFWFVFFYKNDDLCYLRDVRMLGLQAFLANMFLFGILVGKNAYFRPWDQPTKETFKQNLLTLPMCQGSKGRPSPYWACVAGGVQKIREKMRKESRVIPFTLIQNFKGRWPVRCIPWSREKE